MPCGRGKKALIFIDLVLADKEITGKVPRKQIEYAFDLPRQMRNVDKIFARVFGKQRRKIDRAHKDFARSKAQALNTLILLYLTPPECESCGN